MAIIYFALAFFVVSSVCSFFILKDGFPVKPVAFFLVCGLFFAWEGLVWKPFASGELPYLALGAVFLFAAWYDLIRREVPYVISIIAIAAAISIVAYFDPFSIVAGRVLTGVGVFLFLFGVDVLVKRLNKTGDEFIGGGDIILIAVASLSLGWPLLVMFLSAVFILYGVVAIPRNIKAPSFTPLVPVIAVAWLAMPQIMSFYR